MGIKKLLSVAIFLATPILVNAQAPAFTQVIVFGDSLSDDGNIAHRARDLVGFSYPSGNFNYSDYRFTDDTNTSPAANLYRGTWHEQLEKTFLGLPVAKNSLDGGTDYAFGGATTKNGTEARTIINNPTPFGGGDFTIAIDNMGKQKMLCRAGLSLGFLSHHQPSAIGFGLPELDWISLRMFNRAKRPFG